MDLICDDEDEEEDDDDEDDEEDDELDLINSFKILRIKSREEFLKKVDKEFCEFVNCF